MAGIGDLIRRVEKLEKRRGSKGLELSLFAMSAAMLDFPAERPFLLWAQLLPDLGDEEGFDPLPLPFDEELAELTPDDADNIYRTAERYFCKLEEMAEKLADVKELWDCRYIPGYSSGIFSMEGGDDDSLEMANRWRRAVVALIRAADAGEDLEPYKEHVRALALPVQSPISDVRPWPVRTEVKKMKLDTLTTQPAPQQVEVQPAALGRKLAAIAGRESVVLVYTGQRRATWSLPLKPTRRTVTLSAGNPQVQLSNAEARWLVAHPLGAEFEVMYGE